MLVPIRKRTADMAAIYVLNETGSFIWESLDGEKTLADIRDALLHDYEVTAEEASADLLEVVGELQALGVIRLVGDALR